MFSREKKHCWRFSPIKIKPLFNLEVKKKFAQGAPEYIQPVTAQRRNDSPVNSIIIHALLVFGQTINLPIAVVNIVNL